MLAQATARDEAWHHDIVVRTETKPAAEAAAPAKDSPPRFGTIALHDARHGMVPAARNVHYFPRAEARRINATRSGLRPTRCDAAQHRGACASCSAPAAPRVESPRHGERDGVLPAARQLRERGSASFRDSDVVHLELHWRVYVSEPTALAARTATPREEPAI